MNGIRWRKPVSCLQTSSGSRYQPVDTEQHRQRQNHAGKHHHITVLGIKQGNQQQPDSKQGGTQRVPDLPDQQRSGKHQQTGDDQAE